MIPETSIVPLFALVGVLITAAGGVVAAVIASRLKATETLLDAQGQRIASLESDVASFRSTNATLTDYAHELRGHISDGKPPPPPAWPEGLDR